MKKFVYLLLMLPCIASAQNRQIVEATSGEDLSAKVSAQTQYLFPEFTQGDVFYLGLPKGSGILNYNMLIGEMHFLENGQVKALANVKDVVLVNIDNRKFYRYNEKEFVEELMWSSKCQLRVRYKGNAVPHSKKGAYGTASSTSSITSYSGIAEDSRYYNLSVSENVLITLDHLYYLVGTNGKYTIIKNVKTFYKHFPGKNAQIDEFVKEHNTKFNNRDDLKALFAFCAKL